MKKYFVIGTIVFSLMITTVYAFSDNETKGTIEKSKVVYNENCPYHNNEDCPYYDEKAYMHNCPNRKEENRPHHNGNGKGYGRHTSCHHCNQ